MRRHLWKPGLLRSLRKDNHDKCENVTQKYNFLSMQSFLVHSKSFSEQNVLKLSWRWKLGVNRLHNWKAGHYTSWIGRASDHHFLHFSPLDPVFPIPLFVEQLQPFFRDTPEYALLRKHESRERISEPYDNYFQSIFYISLHAWRLFLTSARHGMAVAPVPMGSRRTN